MTRSCVIIPARYSSTRFPGKPLQDLLGTPMVVRVATQAALAVGEQHVYVATEDQRIKDCVNSYGFQTILTESNCLTGTDRVAQASQKLQAYDLFVNVQGDEPLVCPSDIQRCIDAKKKHPSMVVNGFTSLASDESPESFHIPKVVFNEQNILVYASRALVPGSKQALQRSAYRKQVCIYVYDFQQLCSFYKFGRKSQLEKFEDIEILRFFELGLEVLMVDCKQGSLAVDVPSDIPLVEERIKLAS